MNKRGKDIHGGNDRESDRNPVIHNFDRAADTEKSPYFSGGLSTGYTGEVHRIRLD